MHKSTLTVTGRAPVPVTRVHTLVLGSGAAGLNAAVQLHQNGIRDLLILTEGLEAGTSINTGSDKQTYYKLSLCGADTDAPAVLAETFFAGGSMHGDLALVEASLSARCFLNLVNLGVPFPRDAYGQFVGYKTDHDPRQRATSIGPYTSREMCRALIRRVRELQIPVVEQHTAVRLLTVGGGAEPLRAAGCIAMDPAGNPEAYIAENVVFAVGGPGGLYRTSVYPEVHTGAIGLALLAGAEAQSLPESQYGLASTKFRWNVSGTYMQVIPRFISTATDGVSDPQEFMRGYFPSTGEMNSMVFLKGYQWPFDSRKIPGGSSIVDILVYIETVQRGRRVFLDFRANPEGFTFEGLSPEARQYLEKSKAQQDTPIARLLHMNPGAVELYRDHGIDITREPLEIAVCAQHNNGGLAGNLWWESTNLKHLFPVGEVNGSHGVYRPGGSALNSGQVGSTRAAEYIANRYAGTSLDAAAADAACVKALGETFDYLARAKSAPRDWRAERAELQERMSAHGAHIRSHEAIRDAAAAARRQFDRIRSAGCAYRDAAGAAESLRNLQLAYAQVVYLDAVAFALASGMGSRGSAVVLKAGGTRVHPGLSDAWSIEPENTALREKVMHTRIRPDLSTEHAWQPRRPMPQPDSWFETAWASFRKGEIYDTPAH